MVLQFPCNQIVGKKYCMKITKCFSQLLKMSGNYSFRNANSWILDTLTRSMRNSVTVTTVKASKCCRETQACSQLSGVGLFSTVSCRSVFNCQVWACSQLSVVGLFSTVRSMLGKSLFSVCGLKTSELSCRSKHVGSNVVSMALFFSQEMLKQILR